MTETMTPPTLVGWRERLEMGRVRLAGFVRGLNKEYFDWSPDIGIPSIREHLWAIAESERQWIADWEGRPRAAGNYGAGDIAIPEMMKLLDSCGKNLAEIISGWDHKDPNPEAVQGLIAHLERRAHHTGAIAVLAQLIEPERKSALNI